MIVRRSAKREAYNGVAAEQSMSFRWGSVMRAEDSSQPRCWITLPYGIKKDDWENLFPREVGVHAFYPDERERVYAAGSAISPTEFTTWLLALEPGLLWQMAKVFLVAYAGKKVLETIATEVTKDLYRGTKALGAGAARGLWKGFKRYAFAARDKAEANPGHGQKLLLISEEAAELGLSRFQILIELDFDVSFGETELRASLDDIERYFLPVIGCLSSKLAAPIAFIFPEQVAARRWELKGRGQAPWYLIDLSNQTFEPLTQAEWPGEWREAAELTSAYRSCLELVGLRERFQKKRRF